MHLTRVVFFLFLVFMVFPAQLGGVLLYKPLGMALVFAAVLNLLRSGSSLRLFNSTFLVSLILIGVGLVGALYFGEVDANQLWKMTQNVILLVTVIHVVRRPNDFKLAVVGIGTGAVLSAMTGIVDLITIHPYRLEGILGNANGYGQVCEQALACLAGLMIISRKRFVKGCLLALGALCLGGLYYSGSRGAALALVAGILGFLMMKSTRKIGFAFITLGILFAIFIPEGISPQRWSMLFSSEKIGRISDAEVRMNLVVRGWQVYKSSPIVGVGFGNIQEGMRSGNMDDSMVSHNAVIAAMAETGTIGAAAFLFLVFSSGAEFYRWTSSKWARPEDRVIAGTLFVLILQVFIGQLFSGNYLHTIWYALFALNQGYRGMRLGRDVRPLLVRNHSNLLSQSMRRAV